MTAVPHMPFWTWNLLGEDAVYFSQPTHTWHKGEYLTFATSSACVLRCTMAGQLCDDTGVWTHAIQCGMVAEAAPDGTYLCLGHMSILWQCEMCLAWLPEGTGGMCAACKASA